MRQTERNQRGFTMASLLVILTIMAVLLAYTVPKSWSDVMRRERDYQTIWVMKQYARSIQEFQKDRGTMPVSLDQLKEHNTPRRVLRRLYPNPLSGEVDWVPILPGTDTPGPAAPGLPTAPQQPRPPQAGGKFSGPFIGVRPPQTGKSFVSFNGKETYETWSYTINDLNRDQNPGLAAGPGVIPPGISNPQP